MDKTIKIRHMIDTCILPGMSIETPQFLTANYYPNILLASDATLEKYLIT